MHQHLFSILLFELHRANELGHRPNFNNLYTGSIQRCFFRVNNQSASIQKKDLFFRQFIINLQAVLMCYENEHIFWN